MTGSKTTGSVMALAAILMVGFCHSYQNAPVVGRLGAPSTSSSSRRAHFLGASKSGIYMFSAQTEDDQSGLRNDLRHKLRNATGFSLTASRSAWRAATGLSLTAIYAAALAASGLWIRKITSVFLSIFPAWFRYFLQPFLAAYYIPIFFIRGLTGPTRNQAKARHEVVKDSLREAVEFALQTQSVGFTVKVTDDGDLELVSPPKGNQREELANAVAVSVEKAMEQGYIPDDHLN